MGKSFGGRFFFKTGFVIFLALFLSASWCNAEGVILKWDASPDTDIQGYKIYYKVGSSGQPYDGEGAFQGAAPVIVLKKDLRDPDNPEYILFQLEKNKTYFITVTAFSDEEESTLSNFIVATPYEEEPPFDSIRVNAGGDYYIDRKGNVWSRDYGNVKKGKKAKTKRAISDMLEAPLFASGRVGKNELRYQYDLPSGAYTVNCYFSEIKKKYFSLGKRVFDIVIEDQYVARDIDIFGEVGGYTALVKSFDVAVEDGQLDIAFIPNRGQALVSAIEILKKD